MDELTWCSTVPDGRLASASVGGKKIMRARRADGFVAVGVQLQIHGKQTLSGLRIERKGFGRLSGHIRLFSETKTSMFASVDSFWMHSPTLFSFGALDRGISFVSKCK